MFRLLCLIVISILQVANAYAEDAAALQAQPRTITIAADLWCPVNCKPNSGEEGIGVDLARMIFEPQGYKVKYIVVPWARALDDVLTGKIDAVVGANTSDEPRLIFPKHGVCGISYDFYMLKEKRVKYTGFDSLKGLKFGIIKNYGYEGNVSTFINSQRTTDGMVQEVTGEDALEQNIRKLLIGRIDVVVESKPIMDYTLAKMNVSDKVIWVGGTKESDVYLAFSPAKKESRELAAKLDEGIEKLRASGQLEAIYKKYNLIENR